MRIKTIIRKQREYSRMGLVIKEIRKFKDDVMDLYLASEALRTSDHTGIDSDIADCLDKEIKELVKLRNEMEV